MQKVPFPSVYFILFHVR